MATTRSIWSRKRDMIYLFFFAIHLPIMFLVDLVPIVYPTALKPQFLVTLRGQYVEWYGDRFFVEPPAWFISYLYMELFYHVPLSTWALGALIRDDPKLPIHLLVYAVQTAVTTTTCIADFMSWEDFSNEKKWGMASLYVPYICLSIFMGIDMFHRLCAKVNDAVSVGDGQNKHKKKN